MSKLWNDHLSGRCTKDCPFCVLRKKGLRKREIRRSIDGISKKEEDRLEDDAQSVLAWANVDLENEDSNLTW